MSKRNATASWSGYSHQGQVGLLIAIKEIRKFKENDELEKLDNHFLEYESKEDVAIYKEENGSRVYESIHQVKAYYSKDCDKTFKYKKVLSGTFDKSSNNRFLHTTVEIKDWDSTAIENTNSVERYTYNSGVFHCHTDESRNYIIEELKSTCFKNGDEGLADMTLNRLSYYLDEKIRKEHKEKKRKEDYDVTFCFKELDEIISSNKDVENHQIFVARMSFYHAFEKALKNESFDAKQLGKIKKKILKPIYSLEDEYFLEFMKRISLDSESFAHRDPLLLYNKAGFQDVFFYVLSAIKDTPISKENSVVYNVQSDSADYVLTTINQEQDEKEIVRNIMSNASTMNVLFENQKLINRHHSGSFYDLNPSIMNVDTGDEEAKNKFVAPSKHSGLINRDDTLNTLSND